MKLFLLSVASIVLMFGALPATAEIIGVETFDYPNGNVASQNGGTFWDYKNTAPAGRSGTASTWDVVTNTPTFNAGQLVTSGNAVAKREYNGFSESDGAISDANVAKTVYYRVNVTTGSVVAPGDYFGISSVDGGTEVFYFGKRGVSPNWAVEEVGVGGTNSTIPVLPNQTYTLVVQVDLPGNAIRLYVNPDLNSAQSAPFNASTAQVASQAYNGTAASTGVRFAAGTEVRWDNLVVATTWEELRLTIVTTLDDEDDGALSLFSPADISLREAVKYSPAGSLITFAPELSGQTITLTHAGGDMEIPGALTIDATALPGGLTVSGNNTSRHFFVDSGKSLTLRGLSLTGGNGTGAGSNAGVGGVIANEGGTLTLTQCTLSGNSVSFNGGAIANEGGTLTLTQCTLSGNSAQQGGAILNIGGTLMMSQCTLSGNSASFNGGAIYNDATLTLNNSIVSGNSALDSPDIEQEPPGFGTSITATGVNLIGSLAGSTLAEGPTVIVGAPKLSPLGYFGGPVQTMHPLIGSPAIDAAGSIDPGGTDARGFPRFVDGTTNSGAQVNVRLDIGAVEAGPLRTVAFSSDAGSSGALRGLIGQSTEPGARLGFFAANFPAQSITLNGTQIDIPATANGLFIDASNLSGPVTISGNNASRVFNIPATATVAMHSVKIVGGNTDDSGGGILNAGTCTVMASTLSGNSATLGGTSGGIDNNGICAVISSTLSGNSARLGGGINNNGTCTVLSSTFSGNSASSVGGGSGILNNGTCTVVSSTFSGNSTTGQGGGIVNNPTRTFHLTSSIVAGNTPLSGQDVEGSLHTNINNLIGGNPRLAPLGDYGGPTQTMALRPGSPARNAGTVTARSTDQRGFPIVEAPDIGAFEAQIGAIADVSLMENTAPPTRTFPVGQIGALTAASSNTTLVPVANIVITGSGASRSVTVTPAAGQRGICIITLTEDLHGEQQTFQFEVTEDTRFLVTNSNPNGTGSLRVAFTTAAGTAGTNTIRFAPGVTEINLAGELSLQSDDPEIIDAGTQGLILNAGTNSRHFQVPAGRSLTLRGLTLQGGNAGGDGGSIYSEGTLILENCTLSNNNSQFSGGAVDARGDLFRAVNCTFALNTATGEGAVRCFGAEAELIHCTITENTAGSFAGGLVVRGNTFLTNSIIAGNSASDGDAPDLIVLLGTLTPRGANLIGINQSVEAVFPAGSLVGTAAAPRDPMLDNLDDYGGPTDTMQPLLGSPALDQATVLDLALTTDQRGFARPLGIRPDLGAVEASIIVVTTPVDELDAVGVIGNGISLREAIRDVPENGTIGFDRAVFNSLATNVITLTQGPLNPQRDCFLDGSNIPGGLRISHLPTFIVHPESNDSGPFQNVTFTVSVAQLSGGVGYQWRKNGISILGETNESYVINSATGSDEAFYDVVVEAAPSPGSLSLQGVAIEAFYGISNAASIVAWRNVSFGIRASTPSAVLALGESYTLNILAAGPADRSQIKYQWKKNGVNISGATKSSYVITKASLAQAGSYKCEVRFGIEKFSSTSEIVVIDTTSRTVSLREGQRFTASAGAAGNILSYSWSSGQTTKSFSIDSVTPADAGVYTCNIVSHAGNGTTGPITLKVIGAAPALVTPLTLPPAYIGQNYYYQLPVVNTAGAPAVSFGLAGVLPSGLTFNKTTGALSGRPTVTKSAGYPLSFKASNASGTSPAVTATLQVIAVPPTILGSFSGPLSRSTLNGNLGGRFDLTVSTAGTFSGSVMFGALKRSFKSQLVLSAGQGDAILRGNISGITLADRTPVTAYVEFFAAEQLARITLVHPNGTHLLGTGWRKTTPAAATLVNFRLDPGTLSGAPQGYGFGSFKVATTNSLAFTGKLPDGTSLTGSTFVGPNGQILVFQLLYRNKGSLVGQYQLTNNKLTGTVSWFKPQTTTGTVYRDGFGPLNLTAEGGLYTPPAAGQLVMAASAVLDFARGGLSAVFSQPVTIANSSATGLTNTAKPDLPLINNTKITMFDVKKGAVTGSFQDGTNPAPWSAQIVTIGGITSAYGYFLLPTGVPNNTTSPKLSGVVILSAQ